MPASKGGVSKPTLVYAGTYTDTKSKGMRHRHDTEGVYLGVIG